MLAALDAGEPIGTVALRPWFDEAPMAETPWVRGLWVAPAHRGRGVDRLGARWGWRVFNRVDHRGEPMAWLVRELAAE